MSVREATASDSAAIGRVHVRVWREAYAGLMAPERLAAMDEHRVTTRWAAQLASRPSGVRTWVGLGQAGQVDGFAVAGASRDTDPVAAQELYAINVLAHAHGTGLAAALFEAVVEPGPCSLWVVEGNERAVAFYRGRGFVPDGTAVRDDGLAVTECRMVRP